MICPSCKSEYIDSVVICPDCETALIPTPTEEEKRSEELEKRADERPWELINNKPVLLTVCENNFECNHLKAILEDAGIPVMIKHRGSDQYLSVYFGSGSTYGGMRGVELYVPENALEKAIDLTQLISAGEEELLEPEDVMEEESFSMKQHGRARTIITWITIPAILAIIIALFQICNSVGVTYL